MSDRSVLQILRDEIESCASVEPDTRERWQRMISLSQRTPPVFEQEVGYILNRIRSVSGSFPSALLREVDTRLRQLILREAVPASRAQWAGVAFDTALEEGNLEVIEGIFFRMWSVVLQTETGRKAFTRALRRENVLGVWHENHRSVIPTWERSTLEGWAHASVYRVVDGPWKGSLLPPHLKEATDRKVFGDFESMEEACTVIDREAQNLGYLLLGGIPTKVRCGCCHLPMDSEYLQESAERLVGDAICTVCPSCASTIAEQPDGSEGEWP